MTDEPQTAQALDNPGTRVPPPIFLIAVMFASTFAASWSGLAFLLAFGLLLGGLRAQSGSIWPGFLATVLVFVSLAVS